MLFCEWELLDRNIASYFCSCVAERCQKLPVAAKAAEPGYNPYIQTILTSLENLFSVHAQAVLCEIPVDVSTRAAQGIAHVGSSSTSQAL